MRIFDFINSNKNVISDDGTNYIYYNGNGKLKEKFTKKNGKLHGKYFKYDASGEIYSIREFNNGIDINTGHEEKMNDDYLNKSNSYATEVENKKIVLDYFKVSQSSNKSGYNIALVSALLFARLSSESFFVSFGLIIVLGNIIAFFISIFWKLRNFGKVLGVVSFLLCVMLLYTQREAVEKKSHNEKNISNLKQDIEKDLFEPSYKENKNSKELTEYFDKQSNFYVNYKYNIAIHSPRNWKRDEGIAKHTIFRAFEKDSGYTYSVNVIETKYDVERKFWKVYDRNRFSIEQKLKKGLQHQLNTEVRFEYLKITYIKNYKCLNGKFHFTIKDNEDSLEMISLIYQIPKDNFTYTITLTIPSKFYEERKVYFDDILKDIYWLPNKEEINSIILNM